MVKRIFITLVTLSSLHANAALVTLSQQDVANRVLKESAKAKESQWTSELSRNTLTQALSAYDYALSFESYYLIDKQQTFSSSTITETNSHLNILKLSKPFSTGTTLSLEATNNRTNPIPNPAQTLSQVGLTLSQNLWRNFFGVSDRATITAAEKTEQASETSRLTSLQSVVLDGIKLFWKAYVAQENFKEAIASRERYEKLVAVVKRKASLGYANPGEYEQVQAELEGRHQNVKNESTNYLAVSDQLLTLLKLPPGSEIKFSVPDQVPAIPQFSDIKVENLRSVVAQRLKYEAAEQSLRASASKDNPDLTLTAKLFADGLDPDASTSYSELTSGANPMYYLGIKYTATFGSGSAKEEVRNKRLQRDIEKSKYDRLLLEVTDSLNDAKRKIQAAYSVANSMKKQKELREKAAQELQRAYNQGRTDITNFITALNAYFSSQVLYSKAVGDYQIALNEFASLRDELIQDSKSEVKK